MSDNEQKQFKYAKWYAGKTVLVTGATSGIGREMTRKLGGFGCTVLACGRNQHAMDSLLTELEGLDVKAIIGDLGDKDSLRQMILQIQKKYHVDILINNAGFGGTEDFCKMQVDTIETMQLVNMSAVVELCRAFAGEMKDNPGSGILNVGSVASFFPTPGSALYGATKHFISGFTEAIHQEMLGYGVHVSGLYPGKTYSAFLERATKGKLKDWEKAMKSEAVAIAGLKGLSENKIRIIPGIGNKVVVLAAMLVPISMLLRKTDSNKAVKD